MLRNDYVDKDDSRVDRGEMMEGLRKLETPHDVPVEGVPAHDPIQRAANPALRGQDVSPESSPYHDVY